MPGGLQKVPILVMKEALPAFAQPYLHVNHSLMAADSFVKPHELDSFNVEIAPFIIRAYFDGNYPRRAAEAVHSIVPNTSPK